MLFIVDILYGILTLMLVVSGLTVIFGILRIINMAHGEFIMLGAYLAYYAQSLNKFAGYVLAPIISGLIGMLIYWLVVKHVQKRLIDSILATWGVALVLKYGMTLIAGANAVTVAMPFTDTVLGFPLYRFCIIAITLLLLVFLYWLFFRTQFGLRARAVVHNPALSITSGLSNHRIRLLSFVIGCAIAGLAGAILAPTLSVSPLLGESYLIPSFLSVLLGGMDSFIAPLFGAGAIAGSEGVMTRLFNPVVAHILTLVLVVGLLKFFPKGIIKSRMRQ